jgi:hypothetical protein
MILFAYGYEVVTVFGHEKREGFMMLTLDVKPEFVLRNPIHRQELAEEIFADYSVEVMYFTV